MKNPGLEKGFVQVYTGEGKGKTTAALGLALRAIGHGLKVYVIQFMKGNIEYGELWAAKCLEPNLIIRQMGRETFVNRDNPDQEDIKLAQAALALAREVVSGGEYDIVILDEVNCALDFGLIPFDQVLKILQTKPEKVELVLTGRGASPELIQAADLVTEMKEIKHYYRRGIKSRNGIEI
ncbi:MAG: cob(I)yrinic acid a,c-diamide adenosyltransferase [Proteobacteria bacterium]|nr:cob(I)yrinic acid a,c-diamide adenosyltransferase [Pseudomonadota bacterium]